MNEKIRGALARGYCTKKNENKVLDPDLIEDMAIEVEKLSRPEPRQDWNEEEIINCIRNEDRNNADKNIPGKTWNSSYGDIAKALIQHFTPPAKVVWPDKSFCTKHRAMNFECHSCISHQSRNDTIDACIQAYNEAEKK